MNNLKIYFILILLSQLSFAQDRIVSGVVTDSTGVSLSGANISIEGKKHINTTTDFNGNYSIKANSNDFIVFTYVGMIPLKTIANQNKIDVILQNDPTDLRTVIEPDVIKRAKKNKDLYYATTTLSAKDIQDSNDPEFNFKKDAYSPLIFVSNYALKKPDFEFQIKYKISYAPIRDYSPEYVRAYNMLTFKHLKKKYKKAWQSEIRKDAIGLDDFLK